MNPKSPIYFAVSQLLKEVIWTSLLRRKVSPDSRDMLMFSSRRSGSTLLMQGFSSQRGIRFIDQPFGLYTNSRHAINRLPLFEAGQIISGDPDEMDEVRKYVQDIMVGELHVNAPWKFWSKDFSFYWDRSILKITDAKCIINELVDWFDVDSIILFRHPVSQALSVGRNGWRTTGRAFIRSTDFCAAYLTDRQKDFAQQIYASGSALDKRVLDWCLENIPLIQHSHERGTSHVIFYENLIVNPEETLEKLSRSISITDKAKFLESLTQPSRSTKRSSTSETIKKIKNNDKAFLVDAWQKNVTPTEMASAQKILDMMNVSMYRSDSSMPVDEFFGSVSANEL